MKTLDIVLLYALLILNFAGFATAREDKRRAKRNAWRVRERTFLLLAACGGGLGVLLGFFSFRHKTKHAGLMAGVTLLSLLAYGAVIAVRFLLL